MIKNTLNHLSRQGQAKLFLMTIMIVAGGVLFFPVKCMEKMADLASAYSPENISAIVALGLGYSLKSP